MEKMGRGLDAPLKVTSIAFSRMRPLFFKDEETTMNGPVCFERLVASVESIARHAYYPGIDQAIELCLENIDELMHSRSDHARPARGPAVSAAGHHPQRREHCECRECCLRRRILDDGPIELVECPARSCLWCYKPTPSEGHSRLRCASGLSATLRGST